LKLTTLLQIINNNYHFHVYHSIPTDDGYRLETNYGSKRISVWKHEQSLHWSFLWREVIAKKGLRQVDRFIRARDGAPYVKVNEEYIVAQDIVVGKSISLDQPENWSVLGQFVGILFQTFKEICQQDHQHKGDQFYWKKTLHQKKDEESIDGLKKALVTQKESPFTNIVKEHWKSLDKRWKQSSALQRASHSSIVCLPKIAVEQCILLEPGGLSFSSKSQHAAFDYQSVAGLMQELYLQEKGSLKYMEMFYSDFEQIYQPSLKEQYNILSCLIYPMSFFEIVYKYLHYGFSNDESVQNWMELCNKQERLDQLHRWFAERLDRVREDAVSL
jgi:hypothetical protein